MRWWLVLAAGWAASCTLDAVPLDGKRCPCAAGWFCDERANVCVEMRPGATDGGPSTDARVDGGVPAFDAGPEDAGPSDAGPADAGRADAAMPPADAGTSPTECTGALSAALFCDGFEDGPTFPAWTDSVSSDGTVSLETETVYRGTASLRAETTAPGGKASLIASMTTPVSSGDYWFRVYAFFPSTSSLNHHDFAFLADEGVDGLSYYVSAGQPRAFVRSTMTVVVGAADLPRDAWTCIQYHVVVSNAAGAVSIYVDGTLAGERTGLDTLPSIGYSRIGLGITYAPSTEPATLFYFDEVAVGTAPLPCD